MSTIVGATVAAEEERAETDAEVGAALTQRLLEALPSALELLTIELGHRLGLYAALDALGAATAADLARATGLGERQLREWLDQQAIAGILTAHGGEYRTYQLPAAYRPVLLDPSHPLHGAGLATMFAGVGSTFDRVSEGYRRGEGVTFAEFGRAMRHGLEHTYRPGYTHALPVWMEQLPDISARLDEGGTILDLGCGTGWSTVALARRFPNARVVGVDLDEESVAEARANAAESGMAKRVSFVLADAGDRAALAGAAGGHATLVTVFLALHDMNAPQRALSSVADLLEPGGAILVGDVKVEDEFTAPAGPLDRMFSAFSVLHCLPATLAEGDGHAHGTVLRAPTVVEWSREAGLGTTTRLAVEHPTWSFYRLDR
ncbi:class I SAM-dependent methyltransferase [Microbacterium sp. CPCC 204701]|uniref:class I SAM-dependent methyltransferase n=1 Tax=Microbacterium sp. CPCC 204701 TaxID=2493084 RepID=UPI000FD938D7|nr:methyltransferase domain-containing protein [Microbacterium sp. CPCC 204701]